MNFKQSFEQEIDSKVKDLINFNRNYYKLTLEGRKYLDYYKQYLIEFFCLYFKLDLLDAKPWVEKFEDKNFIDIWNICEELDENGFTVFEISEHYRKNYYERN